ncbi:response regulator [Pseudobacteriovorax antillogorgiicola]|uniref:Two-component system, unclassified family, response regulator n=1 Tax=Pseudobacteriovorax antillogorgiicola TaxID=1513793 RepID=A0A1Y6BJ36_9BACT|nr:response regulator [Pseudobacteriovorax antillogorgiicola]TCS56353.1 two-component system response regulator [Pseudobacteriovorax antillogorgiicola]SMF06724.1 two-component system, unclassified family, response regulator [Pseudobacteriovorax antillogorgiicola]
MKRNLPSHVVYIEDDPDDIRFYTTEFNRIEAIDKLSILSSREHLNEFERTVGAARNEDVPSLILMDWKFHDITGDKILSKLRRVDILKQKPMIVISSSDQDKDLESAFENGATSFIQKPEDLVDLRNMIEVLIRYWLEVCARHP